MRIDNATRPLTGIQNPALEKIAGGNDFGKMLTDALKEVNSAQMTARDNQNLLMANQPVDVDELMISMEKASTAMQLTMQLRNKVLEAYQEIMRTQV